jgi:long-chain fatty acid transport protein
MRKILILLSLLLSIPLSAPAEASGLSKPVNIGPKAIGMGGAFVAVSDDPTAIYHNPAGITQLAKQQLYFGIDSLITNEDYTASGAPTESADREVLPVPSIGYVTDHFKPIWVGFGLFFPHGNGGKFSTASAAPLNPDEGRIYSLEITPAIAWQIAKQVRLGATIRFTRVWSSLQGQVIPPSVFPPSGTTLENLEQSGWGVGAAAGLIYQPRKVLTFGMNYRSSVKATLNGSADFTGIGKVSTSLDQTLPTLVSAGFGVRPTESLTIGLSYDFERNSEIRTLTLELSNGAKIASPQNWHDSKTIHVGMDYHLSPKLAVRGGYAKDLDVSIPDTAMNRIIGDIAAHEVSVGVEYAWQRSVLGVTWNARFGSRNVPNNGANPAPGEYEAFVQQVSMGLRIPF